MKTKTLFFISFALIYSSFAANSFASDPAKFDINKDLLLAQFDCKTDVDDLQSAAALAMLLSNSEFSKVRYHAVAGTYGIQEGLYVPPNELFRLAFGDNWTDANENAGTAADKVMAVIKAVIKNGGDIWIAEAGQSDFTARLVKAAHKDGISTTSRFHVVQHSDWNEQVTSAESLKFVRENTDYHKIADGNVAGNGTPGFRSPDYREWKKKLSDPRLISIWQLAVDLSDKYNGREGRYNNEAIAAGGLDFSDLSEVCWILGIAKIRDTAEFFDLFSI